jgi:hypothetical protein
MLGTGLGLCVCVCVCRRNGWISVLARKTILVEENQINVGIFYREKKNSDLYSYYYVMVYEINDSSMNSLAQTTPASSLCWQLWLTIPPWEHSSRDVSSPLHTTLSSQMMPDPDPNEARLENENADLKLSIRHATSASSKLHKSSQMVPHPPKL